MARPRALGYFIVLNKIVSEADKENSRTTKSSPIIILVTMVKSTACKIVPAGATTYELRLSLGKT
jgi:hypothetical protein